MTVKIEESGMTFGPFDARRCFRVEESAAYKAIRPHGVKIAEFAWLRGDSRPPQLWVVEAKSSSPSPGSGERLDEFIDEVRQKLVNALTLVIAARLGRPGSASEELPGAFASMDLATVDARLVLVVKGHRPDRLPPLQEKLQKALRATVKTWGFSGSAVVVMNDGLARRNKLIAGETKTDASG